MNSFSKPGFWLIGILVIMMLSFCSKDNQPDPPADYPQLYINETMPDNESVLEDDHGEHDDWIEIYNPNDEPVDMAGWYISDDIRNYTQFRFPFANASATTIPEKGFLILWADEQPGQGALHLNFRLSSSGEGIYLSANGNNIIHHVTYGPDADVESPGTDRSAGLEMDGGIAWKIFTAPTPGYSNQAGSGQQPEVYVNEFMAGNDSFFADEFGEYDDWIELYNPKTVAVNIGGWYITDDSLALNKWQIPDSLPEQTTISPGGFMLLWADEQPEQGVLHTGIKLNVEGETIGLSADGLKYSQLIRYGLDAELEAPPPDHSSGRSPDGGPEWTIFQPGTVLPPTPGMPNGSAGGR